MEEQIVDTLQGGWQPEFSMLIAMEQIVKYLEMEEPVTKKSKSNQL